MSIVDDLNTHYEGQNIDEILKYFLTTYKGKIAFSTSFSIEDQVLTHLINGIDPRANIFTLDTGRLPYETYKLIEKTNEQYGISIKVFFPNHKLVEDMVQKRGINLFYNGVEERKLCCSTRKIEPLKRALQNIDVWITGLRKEQSVTREQLRLTEFDSNFKLIKLNPLYNWTEEQVWEFIKNHNIPYNELYKKNYTSIGCAPCTRAIREGETVRDGRWWWENPDTKECGLHAR